MRSNMLNIETFKKGGRGIINFCSRRRVAVARYRVICLVLDDKQLKLLYINAFTRRLVPISEIDG